MTLPSRGVAAIQEKARGSKMKDDPRKAVGPKNRKSRGAKVSVNRAESFGSVPGFKKGGSIDGVARKGHTKGKCC